MTAEASPDEPDAVAPAGLPWSLHRVVTDGGRRWELRRRSDDGVVIEVHVLGMDGPGGRARLVQDITPLAGPEVARTLVMAATEAAAPEQGPAVAAPAPAPAPGGRHDAGFAGDRAPVDRRIEVLRRAYELFNAKDVDGFCALLDPDIVWPDLAGGPTLRGAGSVRDYWRNAFTVVSPRVIPHEFLVDDDAVIVVIEREVLDLDGRTVGPVAVVVHRATFRDGRIAKLSITTSDLETPRHVLDRFRAAQEPPATDDA
jgi:ketosteroid isomerase-like protein